MIELISVTNNNVKHFAAVGITAAELPVKDLGTGSTCMMLDTGKKYIYFEGTPTTFIIDQGNYSLYKKGYVTFDDNDWIKYRKIAVFFDDDKKEYATDIVCEKITFLSSHVKDNK